MSNELLQVVMNIIDEFDDGMGVERQFLKDEVSTLYPTVSAKVLADTVKYGIDNGLIVFPLGYEGPIALRKNLEMLLQYVSPTKPEEVSIIIGRVIENYPSFNTATGIMLLLRKLEMAEYFKYIYASNMQIVRNPNLQL
jgi:hypothetical protein